MEGEGIMGGRGRVFGNMDEGHTDETEGVGSRAGGGPAGGSGGGNGDNCS